MTFENRTRSSMRPIANRAAITLAALAAAGLFAFQASSVSAADLPRREAAPVPAPMVVPPVFTWTGFYIGANAGWGTGRRSIGFSVAPGLNNPNIGRLNTSGFIGGLQAGYNWQYGSWVLGLETDIQYAGFKDRLGPVPLVGGGAATASSRLNWYGTVRPRIGYAIDRTLLYVTGGLAYGNPNYRLTSVDGAGNTFTLPKSSTRAGWTIGAGVEHAFNNTWSAKLEYGYVDLGRDKNTAAVFNAGVPTGAIARTKNDNHFHTIRAGVNYRF